MEKKSFFSDKKIFLFFVLIIIIIPLTFKIFSQYFKTPLDEKNKTGQNQKIGPQEIGHYSASDFTLQDLDGKEISLSNFKGENVLLVFWTTWCKWCAKEKPFLKEFAITYNDKIKLIGINIQEPRKLVKKHVEELQLNFPTLLDETGKVAQDYNVRTHPTHVLINKEGKIMAIRPGYADYQDLEKLAEIILKE